MTLNGTREYRVLVAALADAAKRRDAELTGAEQAYRQSAAAASGELARTEGEALAADRWAGAAAAGVLEVDREAARLWEQLRRSPGWRTRGLGEPPEPAHVDPIPRGAIQRAPQATPTRPARELLDRAAERIDTATRRAPRRPVPRWALSLLPLVGAVLAVAASLVAAGLVTLGAGPGAVPATLRTLGWLALLAAPSAGVPVAAYAAHRGLNARLDVGGVGLTLLGGMLAATGFSLVFFS